MVKVRIDMTGWKMWEHGIPDSRLMVIERADDNKHNQAQWLCECNCEKHNKVVVIGTQLRRGQVKSCGCLQYETALRNFSAKRKTNESSMNKYDLSGDYGIGWTSNTNQEFYFDLIDYNLIKDYYWCEYINTANGYHSLRTNDIKSGKMVLMTTILGCKYYDHIDRNPLNCRRSNLRQATQQENMFNRSKMKNNTSGIIGVSWCKGACKWVANIGVNYQRIHLGYFNNKADAIKARLLAEIEYFGDFAPQKHLFNEYEINTIQND